MENLNQPTDSDLEHREAQLPDSDTEETGEDDLLSKLFVQDVPEVKEDQPEQPQPEEPKRKIKVDGREIEVPESELINFAQQGYDYTRKMQALADQRRAVEPLNFIFKQMQDDPAFAQHVLYGYQQPKQQQEAPKPPDDPIERIKWEAKMEAVNEVKREFAPLLERSQAQSQAVAHQQSLAEARAAFQRDPLYDQVHNEVLAYIKEAPETVRPMIAQALDQNPRAYAEIYTKFRETIASRQNTTTEQQGQDRPSTVQRRTTERAPILERPGAAPVEKDGKRVAVSKLEREFKRNPSMDSAAALLEASGLIDSLK